MPDIYLIFSLAGIGFVVLMNMWLGTWAPVTISSEDDARRIFQRTFPTARPERILVSADGAAALLQIGSNTLGIIRTLGDSFVVRQLPLPAIRSCDIREETDAGFTLHLHANDFTLGEVAIKSPNRAALEEWRSMALADEDLAYG